jgi:GNAT superfamily N-acetyltransferase
VDVRSAEAGDEVAIAEVHVRTWQAAYRGLIPDVYLDGLSVSKRRDSWREIINEFDTPATGAFVALHGSDVVGFVHFCPSRDDHADRDVGEITAIYVHPEHWGEGIGRVLIGRALDSLGEAGFSSATLWVLDGNERACRFYEASGWTTDGATKADDRGDFSLFEVRYVTTLTAT